MATHIFVASTKSLSRINHETDNIDIFGRLNGSGIHTLSKSTYRFVNTRSVDENELRLGGCQHAPYSISRGLRLVRNNADFLATNSIEQR